jgi:hypothetical protein
MDTNILQVRILPGNSVKVKIEIQDRNNSLNSKFETINKGAEKVRNEIGLRRDGDYIKLINIKLHLVSEVLYEIFSFIIVSSRLQNHTKLRAVKSLQF